MQFLARFDRALQGSFATPFAAPPAAPEAVAGKAPNPNRPARNRPAGAQAPAPFRLATPQPRNCDGGVPKARLKAVVKLEGLV